jgi:hypothetical protein
MRLDGYDDPDAALAAPRVARYSRAVSSGMRRLSVTAAAERLAEERG